VLDPAPHKRCSRSRSEALDPAEGAHERCRRRVRGARSRTESGRHAEFMLDGSAPAILFLELNAAHPGRASVTELVDGPDDADLVREQLRLADGSELVPARTWAGNDSGGAALRRGSAQLCRRRDGSSAAPSPATTRSVVDAGRRGGRTRAGWDRLDPMIAKLDSVRARTGGTPTTDVAAACARRRSGCHDATLRSSSWLVAHPLRAARPGDEAFITEHLPSPRLDPRPRPGWTGGAGSTSPHRRSRPVPKPPMLGPHDTGRRSSSRAQAPMPRGP